jgi:hypothetical protein
VLAGHSGPVRVPAKQEVDFRAEMADRSTTEGDRFARDCADLGVVDPFVGQFTGEPSAPKFVGIKGDLAQSAGLIG